MDRDKLLLALPFVLSAMVLVVLGALFVSEGTAHAAGPAGTNLQQVGVDLLRGAVVGTAGSAGGYRPAARAHPHYLP